MCGCVRLQPELPTQLLFVVDGNPKIEKEADPKENYCRPGSNVVARRTCDYSLSFKKTQKRVADILRSINVGSNKQTDDDSNKNNDEPHHGGLAQQLEYVHSNPQKEKKSFHTLPNRGFRSSAALTLGGFLVDRRAEYVWEYGAWKRIP